MKATITSFARNTVFANIVLVLILLAGVLAAKIMTRELFPQFSLDMIMVVVPYPGADPEEVEEGISRKIEEAIEGLEGIKQYRTESSENVSHTVIEIIETYDVQDVMDRVRSKVDSISTFPVDAERPVIQELLIKETVLMLALSGDMSERRLKEWAERLKDEVQQLPPISQVQVSGVRDYEIGIEISEERLREYGLSFSDVADAIRRSSLNMAGGTVRTEGEEIRLRTMGRKYTGDELAEVVVLAKPEGDIITLDRLATIKDGFIEDPLYPKLNGKPTVFLNISKTQREDTIAIAQAVKEFVEKKRQQLPTGAKLDILYDRSESLQSRINLLTRNGIIGLTLVFLTLWAFLDFRLSFWAGLGMPISVAGALAVLWAWGGTINMISLFGLIMVLGIIVDDAIVVGEAIYVQRRHTSDALHAAVGGVVEVGLPVLAAVTTTIVAFLPLAFVAGVMGKFIAILPVVVIACLSASLLECLFLLPAHLSHLPDPHQEIKRRNPLSRLIGAIHGFTSKGLERFVEKIYGPFMETVLQWRYLAACVMVSILLVVLGIVRGAFIKFEVFPKMDGYILNSTVEFPSGTPASVTQDAVKQIEDAMVRLADKTTTSSGKPLLEHVLSLVGGTLGEEGSSGPHVGSVQAVLIDSEFRGIHSKDLAVSWEREVGAIPGVQSLTFAGMQGGPPGAPIEVWLQGHDMSKLLLAADDLIARLKQFEGVYQIRSDFRPGKKELRLRLKPEARAMGLTVNDLARQVHAGYFGEEAIRLQRGRDDIRVRVRYTEDERKKLSDLEKVRIRTHTGMEVPLLSVAEAELVPGYATITRQDGNRRVVVSADVDTVKTNANEIIGELQSGYLGELRERFPNVFVSFQGEQKNMRESLGSLFVGFPMALLGIFIIIATIFRSYIQPVIIMLTVPFGIIGAVIGHLLMGYDLSIMSVFGMVALSGVVVNDAIVLIECINSRIASGLPFFEAVKAGGVRRFRAVFLTTISTVGGLTPLIIEKDLQARFLIPMALSLAAGVAFATLLTLGLIPCLLGILNDLRRCAHWLKTGDWPTREEVEPATSRKEAVTS